MLTYLQFPSTEIDLNESYKMAFRKKKVKIRAYNNGDEDDHEAGSITYSIFDFRYLPFDIDDAMAECASEEWGETEFFEWVVTNKQKLEKEFLYLEKFIFVQELDLNVTMINEENVNLIINAVNEEHNIYLNIAVLDTLYANPDARIKPLFQKLGWKKLEGKYYFKG